MDGIRALVMALALAAGPAFAQTPAESPPPVEQAVAAAPTEATFLRLAAGTTLEFELTEALGSRTSQESQLFGLRLATPIVFEGREIVPAGAIGGGEVIDATPSGFGGRQGRLIISGRFIEIAGQRVRIRGMQITAVGADNANMALAVSMVPYAGFASLFITGGEITISAGARGIARLATDVDIPIEMLTAAAAPETAPVAAPQTDTPVHGGESQQ